MNKKQTITTLIFVVLLLTLAVYGIVLEAKVTGKTNGFAFNFYSIPSAAIATGLLIQLFFKDKNFKTMFIKSWIMTVFVLFTLGLFSTIHYKGINQALEWFKIFIYNPLEVFIPVFVIGLFLFILQIIIHLIGKNVNKKIN
jgi:hypothetical protein